MPAPFRLWPVEGSVMSAGWDLLVVDDEPVVRDAVRLVLAGEGFTVAAAASGGEALAHEALADCRLVLCDLMLPDISGIDLVRSLRRGRPDLPVILITGYPTSENALAAIEAGASDFLPKPFTESELLAVVRRILKEETSPPRRRQP